MVIRNSEPSSEKKSESGGEIVRVTPAQASTKTKIRGELFN